MGKRHLRQSSRLLFLEGRGHLLVLGLVLMLLTCEYKWFIVVMCVYFFWVYKVARSVFLFILFLIGVYLFRGIFYTVDSVTEAAFYAEVIRPDVGNELLYVKTEKTRAIVYVDDVSVYRAGDVVYVRGVLSDLDKPSMPYQFDYPAYLESIGVGGVVVAEDVEVIDQQFSLYTLRGHVSRYLLRFGVARPYLEAFIIGERASFDGDVDQRIKAMGVAHLFAISGLHVTLVSVLVYKMLGILKVKTEYKDIFLTLFLGVYMSVAAFTASIVRSGIFIICLIWVKRTPLQLTAVDVLAWIFYVLLLVNPLYYRQIGFVLTFLVTFSLLLSRQHFESKGILISALKVSVIAFLVTLPIIVSFQNAIHPMTVFFNVVLVMYTMFIMLPLSYLTFIFPFMEMFLSVVIYVFEGFLAIATSAFPLQIPLAFTPRGWVVVYYGGLLYFLMGDDLTLKRGVIVFCVLFGVFMTPYLDFRQQVVFFHVHGDSILLKDAHNRCNILIDTGESDGHNQVLNSLQNMHVRRLDYVFITHWHYDHYGAYESISETIHVKRLYTRDDQAELENRWIQCGAFSIFVFERDKLYVNENNNSLVKVVRFGNETILFTGDIEASREASFEDFGMEITMLKVPHHGSISSATKSFLQMVSAEDAVISAHRNNRFDHPSEILVQRLLGKKMAVHRTDEEGTISFIYYFNERRKKTGP